MRGKHCGTVPNEKTQKNTNAKLLLLVKLLQPFHWSEIGIKHLGLCHPYKYICYQSCVGLNCVWTNFVFAENILRKQWKIRKNFRGISKCWVLKFSQKERYNFSRLRRVWLVKSWLTIGKSLTFFYSVLSHGGLQYSKVRNKYFKIMYLTPSTFFIVTDNVYCKLASQPLPA